MDTSREVTQWECTACGWVTNVIPNRVESVDPRYPFGACACWRRTKAEPIGRAFQPVKGSANVVAEADTKALQLFIQKHNTTAFRAFLHTFLDLEPAASFEIEEATGELHQTVSAKISTLAAIGALVPRGRHRTERGTEAVAYVVTPSIALWLKENP